MKDDLPLYKIARKNRNKIFTSKGLSRLFGYSENTHITKTRANKFIQIKKYRHPTIIWYILDERRVGFKDLPERFQKIIRPFIYYPPRQKHIPGHSLSKIISCDRIFLENRPSEQSIGILYRPGHVEFLIKPEYIPFWKLKEYGGWIW